MMQTEICWVGLLRENINRTAVLVAHQLRTDAMKRVSSFAANRLCDECEHTLFPDGTNGGIGFNAAKLPDGMKRHCKKSAQQFTPWYARTEEVKG